MPRVMRLKPPAVTGCQRQIESRFTLRGEELLVDPSPFKRNLGHCCCSCVSKDALGGGVLLRTCIYRLRRQIGIEAVGSQAGDSLRFSRQWARSLFDAD